ncbi:MAG: helix-turn-helix transcriptional regulator [Nitrospirae bacterium]|nr:helix-turn-helix transcriptional regulator [Nitrospirota bacterium]
MRNAGTFLQQVGRRIRELRKRRKLSQEKLAELAGIHPTHMNRIEAGRINMTAAVLQGIGKSLGVSVAELVDVGAEQGAAEDDRIQSLARRIKQLKTERKKIVYDVLEVLVRTG